MTFADFVSWSRDLLPGLWVSIKLTIVSLAFGLPAGLVLGVAADEGSKWLGRAVAVIVEIGRGTPALVMLYLVYFGFPDIHIVLNAFWSVVVAFGFTVAAYTSEIFRGAIKGVDAGEVEAAAALGMSRLDTYRYIIVPQAVRIAIPSLLGFSILVFQGTSLAFAVALPELLSRAYTIGNTTFRYVGVLAYAAVLYAVVTIVASALVNRLARGRPASRRGRPDQDPSSLISSVDEGKA